MIAEILSFVLLIFFISIMYKIYQSSKRIKELDRRLKNVLE